jgi:hypothetical protein
VPIAKRHESVGAGRKSKRGTTPRNLSTYFASLYELTIYSQFREIGIVNTNTENQIGDTKS